MASTSPAFWVGDWVIIFDLSGVALEVFANSLCIMEAGDRLVFGCGGPGAAGRGRGKITSVREGYG